jgi:MHS family proline/betaine transporter-like MFS transporter
MIEFYDYSIFSYLAPYLAVAFFGGASGLTGLLLTYGLLAVGSAARILGGAVFGGIGDRFGRKRALMLALAMMTAAITITALLPSYGQIGVAAAVLFVVVRLVQGFSAGGEYAGALVFLIEESPRRSRGLAATVGVATSGTGVLLASGVALALTAFTTDAQMDAWGWRIGYGFGALLAVAAIAMRLRMEESAAFERARAAHALGGGHPLRDVARRMPGRLLSGAILIGFGGLIYYMVLTFVPTYLETVIGSGHVEALLVTTIMVALWAYLTPLGGMLSDVVGRKPMLIGAAAAFAVLGYPAFLAIATGELGWIMLGELILVIPLIAFHGAVSAAAPELFPTGSRYSALGVSYNTGNALIGSTAPFVGTLLVSLSGNDLAPGWYLVAAALLTLPVAIRMRESARRPLLEAPAPGS